MGGQISNVPPLMEEHELRVLFENDFGPVSKFKFITNNREPQAGADRKMALIELPTVQVRAHLHFLAALSSHVRVNVDDPIPSSAD